MITLLQQAILSLVLLSTSVLGGYYGKFNTDADQTVVMNGQLINLRFGTALLDYCTDPLVHRGRLTATSELTGRRAQDGFLECELLI